MSDRKKSTPRKPSKQDQQAKGKLDPQISNFFEGLIEVSTQAIKYAAGSTSTFKNTLMKTPERLVLMGEAGKALKDMRETAGLTLDDMASVLEMEDPGIIKAIEEGTAALPIDIMVRLASFYSRNDPLPFIIRFSRTYHPVLSEMLNKTGLDRLMIQAEREMKFIKIYRNLDGARKLSDEGFDKVLEFTQKAFVMALHFVAEQENVKIVENPEGAFHRSQSKKT